MKYFVLITLVIFSLVGATHAFAETLPNGETIITKTNGVTFKLGDTLQLTIEDYNNGAQKNIDTIKSTYPGILSPCGISYFDFVFLRGDHTNISTFDGLVAAKDDALNVAYDMPYNIVSCPLGYFKSINDVTLESNSHNAIITYVNGNGAIEIKNQLIAVRQIDIPFGKESLSLGKYTVVAFSMSGKIGKPLLIEVIANSSGMSLDKTVYPIDKLPLRQFKDGTPIDEILCKENLVLVIKSTNGYPACVTYPTGANLLLRGWAVCSEHIDYDRGHPCGPHSSGVVSFDSKPEDENKSSISAECETEFKPKTLQHTVFPNGTSLTVNYIPVFLMKPNSTGKICTTNWNTGQGDGYSGMVLSGVSKEHSPVSDISIVPNPDHIAIDDANKTIVYMITVPNGSQGFYRIIPMFFNCGGLPLAVGYDKSHSFDDDFPWLWDVYPCPFQPVNVQITGLSGIDVAYIAKTYD